MDSTSIVHLVRTLNETSGWETAYVISNCIIALFAVTAIVTLFNYRFLKAESKKNAKRSEINLAISISEKFVKNTDTIRDKIHDKQSAFDYIFIKTRTFIKEISKLKVEDTDNILDIMEDFELGTEVTKLLNEMETLSLVILNNLANEVLVFNAVGKLYCKYVAALSPFIAAHSEREEYVNIITLFERWSKRLSEYTELNKKRFNEIKNKIQ